MFKGMKMLRGAFIAMEIIAMFDVVHPYLNEGKQKQGKKQKCPICS